jgi:hypothetical protein
VNRLNTFSSAAGTVFLASILILSFVTNPLCSTNGSPETQAGPAVSRGELLLSINGAECMKRAAAALQSEGFSATLQAANLYFGQKGIHSAYIMCNAAPEGKMWVNLVVASEAADGTIPGAERERLQARILGANQTAKLITSCWKWSVELKNGARHEAQLQMWSDGRAEIKKWNISGRWTSQGAVYIFDWGRGQGNQDRLTFAGNAMTGSNFETNWIRAEQVSCG